MEARLFYVPIAAAFEAERIAEAADWAEVESCDSPGAGGARGMEPNGFAGVVAAATARLDELGWERCCLLGDSHSQAATIELALANPGRFAVIGISHAAAHYRVRDERPPMTPALHEAAEQLLETDYRTFARAITQLTLGLASEEWMERWLEAVPQRVAQSILGALAEQEPELVSRLAGTDLPVVLGQHRGCIMWTPEAFADACDAVPHAQVVRCDGIPAQDPRFLAAVREAAARVAST